MNIYEAASLGARTGNPIIRMICPSVMIYPTDTADCCRIVDITNPTNVGLHWEPTLDDLTSKDWAVVPLVNDLSFEPEK